MKKGDESQFLYDTHVEANVEDATRDVAIIYNGRLKISRICYGKSPFRHNSNRFLRAFAAVQYGPHRSRLLAGRIGDILTRGIH